MFLYLELAKWLSGSQHFPRPLQLCAHMGSWAHCLDSICEINHYFRIAAGLFSVSTDEYAIGAFAAAVCQPACGPDMLKLRLMPKLLQMQIVQTTRIYQCYIVV
jgi:hypothetical protein